ELLRYADSNAIVLKSSVLQQNISASQAQESKSYLYPNITGTSGFNDNLTLQKTLVPEQLFNSAAPEGSFKEMKFGKQYMYSAGVQAQWNFLDFQKMFASKTAALQVKADQSNTQRARYNTYNQLAYTYYSILMDKDALLIYQKNKTVSAEMLSNAKEKYSKGIISEADYNEAAMQNLKNERDVASTQQDIETLYRQLQTQLNLTETIVVSSEDSNRNNTQQTDSTFLWATHPEVAWQQTQVDLAHASLKESKALRLPSLSANYAYNYNWAMTGFVDFSNASHLPQQYVGLKLSVPIFNGFSTKQKIAQSQFAIQQQELQLENIKITEAKQDEILVIQYRQSADKLQKNKDILDLQDKTDFHYANQYKSGLISLDARLTKYKDLLSAQNDYLQSLADYRLSAYKLYIRQLNYQPLSNEQ
ncbi:MAG: hypothetical protein DI598_14725, partial [Pseudopedobacter saltans]